MPTITLQVGQCGNQLGATFWDLLQQQQARCSSSSIMSREWFARNPAQQQQVSTDSSTPPTATADASQAEVSRSRMQPRCICVDSEAKVVKAWQSPQEARCSSTNQTAVHMLGKGGGCGNNWSCGYSLAFSTSSSSRPCAWSVSDDTSRCIDQVLDGIRKESEREAGVPDFLLLSSLAGGTGSGFGSALLETLADEYPYSTVAAAAVAPGRAGGSDTATQSINCCLALQHLSQYAHAVLLLDNQVLLDQLNASNRHASNSSSNSSSSSRKVAGGSVTAVSGRACLQGVNELAAQALAGLLWPVGEADQLARNTNIRQLATTVAGDPLTTFLEVCHVPQSDADIPVNMLDNPWPARIKLLASQLPSYDPFHPTQPVWTSAAFIVARGGLCSQPSKGTYSKTGLKLPAVQHAGSIAGRRHSSSSSSTSQQYSLLPGSCWVSRDGIGSIGSLIGSSSGSNSSSTVSSGGWAAAAAVGAVSSSWPRWCGSTWDAQFADCTAPLYNAKSGSCTSSLSAAVRRSSTGSFLRDVSSKCRKLCHAGAYMHWYQQYGTEPAEIEEAAALLADLADGY